MDEFSRWSKTAKKTSRQVPPPGPVGGTLPDLAFPQSCGRAGPPRRGRRGRRRARAPRLRSARQTPAARAISAAEVRPRCNEHRASRQKPCRMDSCRFPGDSAGCRGARCAPRETGVLDRGPHRDRPARLHYAPCHLHRRASSSRARRAASAGLRPRHSVVTEPIWCSSRATARPWPAPPPQSRRSGGHAVSCDVDLDGRRCARPYRPGGRRRLRRHRRRRQCGGDHRDRHDRDTRTMRRGIAMMAVNLRAPFRLMRAATPHLVARSGSVVNVSSVNGLRSFAGVLAYSVSKAGRRSPDAMRGARARAAGRARERREPRRDRHQPAPRDRDERRAVRRVPRTIEGDASARPRRGGRTKWRR